VELSDATQAALGKAMQATLWRGEALAENIANANTPGYQRRDLRFEDAIARALQRGGGDAVRALELRPHVDAQGLMRPDGGEIDIDRESAAMAANRLHFEALVAVKEGRGAIFRTAAGLR
jgi:flagellar basal-body rod protein FlgB